MRLTSFAHALLVTVILVFPVLKICDVWKGGIPNDDLSPLRLDASAQQNPWHKIGYGMARRLDDTSYWVLIAALLSASGIFALHKQLSRMPGSLLLKPTIQIIVGLLFGVAYLCCYFFVPALFGSSNNSGLGWFLQAVEVVLTFLGLFVAGLSVAVYFQLARVLQGLWNKKDTLDRSALLRCTKSFFSLAFVPLISVTLFAAATTFIPALTANDRITLVLPELAVFVMPYFLPFLWGRRLLRENIEFEAGTLFELFEIREV